MVCTEMVNALTLQTPPQILAFGGNPSPCSPLNLPRFPQKCHQETQETTAQLTIFCDLDGPIIDVSERYYQTYLQAWQTTCCAQSRLPLSKDHFWQLKQERTADTEIARRSGIPESLIPKFLNTVAALVNQPQNLSQDQLQPGVQWALALLQDAGVRLVLVTLRPQAEAEQLLHQYHLYDYFDQVWGSTDSDAAYRNNTAQKCSLLALAAQHEQIQAHPNPNLLANAWMIGDTEADVVAGQALNVSTLALTCGIRSHRYLAQLNPTRITRDLVLAVHYLLGLSAPVEPAELS
jgi:phosphoglycolate phosphatase